MTTVAPRILSAISGGAFRPWHYARTETERHQVIQDLLGQDSGHVLFYLWDRPAGGEANEYPRQQLKIVYNGGMGAAHYTNGDTGHGPVGAWLARADHAPTDPPEVIFDPWDPDRVSLPTTALLPTEQLRDIAEDYAATGRQPTRARWTSVEWV
ncbi:Imm1 family immunity protein [Actinophytocola oryzae]|uniref:Immunity protein Imm1 of predicted polymorphic toxin system n=1 Tax=Actinophytocola oryzae TaxID=502181 RepID=A0A4R7VWA3_9PSEU|nr:Imm1 family immunity protein [Actinophytocola oryzae]TDV53759.1 immunity protein Imm1 of predicted polymorphic toxin system [Actinophytocola oryzae]